MDSRQMDKFLDLYQKLNANNLESLREVYRADIHFIDPAHQIQGLEELTTYFHQLYRGVKYIEFHFSTPLIAGNSGTVRWEMIFSHKKLAQGKRLSVEGISHVEFDREGKVYFHRDYFDLGAMLYENIPLLGRLVVFLKERLVK